MLKKHIKYFGMFLVLLFISCAKRGSITGGLKDTIAPVLKMSFPKNYSTGFKEKTIKLSFDEFIKLKDLNKQLIISPPMKKTPQISPTTASKYITININDTLQPNTTYSINFGQSITDNNEGNPYKQFKYIFSTGSHIDSLSLNGTIKDAYNKKSDSFVTVMLYEINEKFTDSLIYKENPRYVTNTLDSATSFKLENLKAGKYLLVALKDVNSNYKFNSKTEKIGFRKKYITIPNDSVFELKLFKEVSKFKAFKPSQASGNRMIIGYEGNPKEVKLLLKKGNDNLKAIITKFPKKDSLQVWHKPIKIDSSIKTDSLNIDISTTNYSENFTFKIKNQKNDSLTFVAKQNSVLPLNEKFTLNSSTPLLKFDTSKMQLINKDSITVAFKTEYDEMNQELKFDFQKEPLEKYKLKLFPGALTDYMEQTNDSLIYKFETKNISEYGNLRLKLENVKEFPVIIELTDAKGEILASSYSENNSQIDFNMLKPALFTLRVIYDVNKNKIWDSGSFLDKKQSEEVIYFSKEIDVRANWDVEQVFDLKLQN